MDNLRESIMAVGVRPGCDVRVEVLYGSEIPAWARDMPVAVRVTAVRRDTNSIRPARLDFDPERTPR
jgi:hypothetical protein